MTAEAKELYNYVTGVEPFCSEISELQTKKEILSYTYTYTKLTLKAIISQADRQYTKDHCSEKFPFTELNRDAVLYQILSGMYEF